jgi:hypothetical protein
VKLSRLLPTLGLLAVTLACSLLTPGPATTPVDSQATIRAAIIQTQTAAFIPVIPTITSTPTFIPPSLVPTTDDPTIYGGIKIEGSQAFIDQTRAALALLESLAPDAFLKTQKYVGVIQQGQHSGMWAWEEPPRYEVGDPTAFYSVTWYASTIAHDATHSELYHQYQAAHPGEPVPDDAWGGVEIERFCIGYQLDVARRIGAPASEVEYLASLDGTHCDVDGDNDCDWDDYYQRDW